MKKFVSMFLSLVMVLSLSATAFAADSTQADSNTNNTAAKKIPVSVDAETTITVVVPCEYKNLLDISYIRELANSNDVRDGDVITIYEINDVLDPVPAAQTRWGYTYKTTKSAGSEWKAQNYFLISAAKGQTTTLSSKFSATLKTTITAGSAFIEADIGGSVTAEYSTSHQFVGPPENSSYNSREFRVQFYAKTVTFTQKKINSSNQVVDTRSGTASVPTRYAMYSIDRKL